MRRSAKNRKQFDVKWSEKIGTAVFRGNATGGGVTPKTNQRLRLAKLSAEWAKNPDFNGEADGTGVRYVDAGVVGWNKRDKKVQGERMRFIDPKKLGLKLVERIPCVLRPILARCWKLTRVIAGCSSKSSTSTCSTSRVTARRLGTRH